MSALLGLAVVVAFPVLMVLSIMNPTIRSERQHERLVQTGTRATATITHIAETGTVINRRPEVQVSVTVQPQDAPAFRSQSTWAFSVSDIQRYRVGTEVHVFFDPEDHEAVAVVGVARSADEEEPLR